MKFFEVFRAGTYPQGVFSIEDVESLAKNYDPKFCEAPITLDHEQKGPAYGWVSELKADNGKLKASFRDVADELKDYVQAGKYRKISVEIYKQLDGKKPYLKAVSFLGASIPQVKGMEPIKFKDGESDTYIFEVEADKKETNDEFQTLQEIIKLQNYISEIESKILHLIDQPDGNNELIASLQEKIQELSAQMKQLEESETLRQRTEQELKQLKQKMRSNEFEQFLSEQITSGNLTPAQKDTSLKLFMALDNTEESSYIEDFKNFIKTLPKQVELGEIATKKGRTSDEEEFIDFANASEDSLAIYKEAKILAEKENISFKDALLRLYE